MGRNALPADLGERGSSFRREIAEQPDALRRLVATRETFAEITAEARGRGATLVRLVGHGSSDNAASYGVYSFGLLPGWTAMRDSISLTVNYHAERDLSGSLVVALSQSGQTPDVVEYVTSARAQGAFTVGVTNHVDSDLALAADSVIALSAGPEQAVAATKTYLNTVASLALLAAYAAGEGERYADGILEVADLLDAMLPDLEEAMPAIALPFAFVGRMFVIGRGHEFATAREIALKLLETCYVAAEPLTATDLAHGPIAALDPLFPVWAVASAGEMLPGDRRGCDPDPRGRCDDRRERNRRRGSHRCPLRPRRPDAVAPAALTAAVGRSGPGLRARPGTRSRARPRSSAGSEQGHLGALSASILA